jgi:hypothetical protein
MLKKTQSPPTSPARPLSKTTNELITPIIITKRNQTNSNLNPSITENTLSDTDMIIATPKNNKSPSTRSPGLSPLNKHPIIGSFFTTPNRYANLDIEDDHNMETTEPTEPIIHKPPPIFIKSDADFLKFCTAIKLYCDTDDFTCKSNTSGIKLQLNTPDTFRKAVQLLKSKEVNFHTYQIKDEKAFRVVLRNLHQSTPLDFIKDELSKHGFKVKQVTTVLQNQTKKPLPLFFVDLEPKSNNNDIFKINLICHSVVKFEEPLPKKQLTQCHRCQNFGHTKHYYNYQSRCVKCDGSHSTNVCPKLKDEPPKCTLCGEPHPANYRGCPAYKSYQQQKNTNSKLINKPSHTQKSNITLYKENNVKVLTGNDPSPNCSNKTDLNANYADVLKNTNQNDTPKHNNDTATNINDLTKHFSLFISDLKSVINPLISLLTTVINKIILKNY